MGSVHVLGRRSTPARPGLTPREREVATMLGSGMTGREIADALGLEERTVRRHVRTLLRKLGVQRRGDPAAPSTRPGHLQVVTRP